MSESGQFEKYIVTVKKQIDVSFSCVCPIIDNEYHHNIVKSSLQIHLAITLWIHSYFNNVMMKFVINNRTDAWKSDINLLKLMEEQFLEPAWPDI